MHKDLLILFLVEKPNARVIEATKSFAKSQAILTLGFDPNNLTREQICILEYTSSAQLGLIGWWLTHTDQISIKELAKLMEEINSKGPFTLLKEQQHLQ